MTTTTTITKTNFDGRAVPVDYACVAGSTDPTTIDSGDWQAFGSVNNKTWNLTAETSDNTSDDTNGMSTGIVTLASFEAGISVFAIAEDGTMGNQIALHNYFATQTLSGASDRQPVVWLRATFPGFTAYAYVNITAFPFNASTTDTVSSDLSFSAAHTNSNQSPYVVVVNP